MTREDLFNKSKEQDNNPTAINIRPVGPIVAPAGLKPAPEKKDGK